MMTNVILRTVTNIATEIRFAAVLCLPAVNIALVRRVILPYKIVYMEVFNVNATLSSFLSCDYYR